VVTVAADGTVTRNAEYYALGHLSRFVQPGAVRIASTSFGTAGWNGQLIDVAFRNPDGTTAFVVHNENDDPRSFAVRENGRDLEYTLPGGALATFVWATPAAPAQRAIDPAGWVASADPNGPSDPCCRDDVASHAVDDDATTRYSTGAAQAPGQYLEIDLGRLQRLVRLELDTGASTGDYPRGYAVQARTDGSTWTTVGSGAGSGQFTPVALPGTPVRYLRVTLTASSDSWWSVADVRAYVRTH
jgi:glucosylceramidase